MSSESNSDISQSINSTFEDFSNEPNNLNVETNNFDESTESILLNDPETLPGTSNNWKYILITFCLIGVCLYIFKKMKKEKEKIKQ